MVTLRNTRGNIGDPAGSLSVEVPKQKGEAVTVVLRLEGEADRSFVVSRKAWLKMLAEATQAAAYA